MIVVLADNAAPGQVEEVRERLHAAGYRTQLSQGEMKTLVGALGEAPPQKEALMAALETLPFVERVIPVTKPYKLAMRAFRPEGTRFTVRGVTIGGGCTVVIAGPCSVETEEQILASARAVAAAGAAMLRGGAYKPRTGPYSFQGLGREGLQLLVRAREETGLPFITEVMDPRDVELVAAYTDVLQVGARSMQNYTLLREVGRARTPVMLKRGLSATFEEWLQAAEYILAEGNADVMLCERGIRTYETQTRNTLDLSAVPVLRDLSHLPVIVDPSHGTGKTRYVPPMARAAVAAGADGLMIEIHPDPTHAWTDGAQALDLPQFAALMRELAPLASLCGRPLAGRE
jgi:3-deoxy-7-phosphoheptulonate synthase